MWSPAVEGNTLVWSADSWNSGTISPGRGVLTYRARVPVAGRYRWAARMAAPHTTDWNDFWVRFPGGVTKQRYGGQEDAGGGWLKIYSNKGGNTFVWGGGTVDHHPHMLLTPWTQAGGVVEFQISGRSNQVAVAALGLRRCEPDDNGSWGCADLAELDVASPAECY